MASWVVTRTIAAPVGRVFSTVADIAQFSRAIPQIVKVEYLSDVRSGVGTRFRETRLMKSKEITTELEVTEWVVNDHVRLVADSNVTVWDSVFGVREEQGASVLTLTMDALAGGLLARVITFLIRGMVQQALESDMDSVKAFCEREAAA